MLESTSSDVISVLRQCVYLAIENSSAPPIFDSEHCISHSRQRQQQLERFEKFINTFDVKMRPPVSKIVIAGLVNDGVIRQWGTDESHLWNQGFDISNLNARNDSAGVIVRKTGVYYIYSQVGRIHNRSRNSVASNRIRQKYEAPGIRCAVG